MTHRFHAIYIIITTSDALFLWSFPWTFIVIQLLFWSFNFSSFHYQRQCWRLMLGPPVLQKGKDYPLPTSVLSNWLIWIFRWYHPHDTYVRLAKACRGVAEKSLKEVDSKDYLDNNDFHKIVVRNLGMENNGKFQFSNHLMSTFLDAAIDHPHCLAQIPFMAMILLLIGVVLSEKEMTAVLYMDTIFRVLITKFAFQENHIQMTNLLVVLSSTVAQFPVAYVPPLHQKQLDKANFTLGNGYTCPGYALAAGELAVAANYSKDAWEVKVHDMGGSLVWPVPTFTAIRKISKGKKE